MEQFFTTDQGGPYRLTRDADGVLLVHGLRSAVTYTSPENRLEQTGVFRRQPKVGWGARAVLILDTGEGLSTLRGVMS